MVDLKIVLVTGRCKDLNEKFAELKRFYKKINRDFDGSLPSQKTHYLLAYNTKTNNLVGCLKACFSKSIAYIRCDILDDYYGKGVVKALLQFEKKYALKHKIKVMRFV